MFNFTSAIPFVGSLWNHFLQSAQQSRSEDFAREMFGKQRDANTQMAQMMIGAQRWNMKNQASLNRSGMVSAGLNPNNPNGLFTTGGISPSTPSTSPTSATYNAPDTSGFTEFGKLLQNQPVIDAQARAINAEAEGYEIDNANKQKNYDLSFANIQANTDKLLADAKHTESLNEYQILLNSRYNEITDAELKYTIAKTGDANWSAKEREEHINVYKKQVEEMASHIRNMDADTSLTGAKRNELISRAFSEITQGKLNEVSEKLSSAEYNTYYTRVATELAKDKAFTQLTEKQQEAVAIQVALGAKDLDWYTFDKICQGLNVSSNVAASIWKLRTGFK